MRSDNWSHTEIQCFNKMATVNYLTIRDVLIIHQSAILLIGGSEGVRDQNALESALNQVQQVFSDQELYPDLWTKAAAYAFFICQNYPFIDGNKRTAALATNTFLNLNGHRLTPPRGEVSRFFIEIAKGNVEIEEIAAWIQAHSTS